MLSTFVSRSAAERAHVFDIDQKIIEVIVEDLFFKPNDDPGEQSGDKDVNLDKDDLARVLMKHYEGDARAEERALYMLRINGAENEYERTASLLWSSAER